MFKLIKASLNESDWTFLDQIWEYREKNAKCKEIQKIPKIAMFVCFCQQSYEAYNDWYNHFRRDHHNVPGIEEIKLNYQHYENGSCIGRLDLRDQYKKSLDVDAIKSSCLKLTYQNYKIETKIQHKELETKIQDTTEIEQIQKENQDFPKITIEQIVAQQKISSHIEDQTNQILAKNQQKLSEKAIKIEPQYNTFQNLKNNIEESNQKTFQSNYNEFLNKNQLSFKEEEWQKYDIRNHFKTRKEYTKIYSCFCKQKFYKNSHLTNHFNNEHSKMKIQKKYYYEAFRHKIQKVIHKRIVSQSNLQSQPTDYNVIQCRIKGRAKQIKKQIPFQGQFEDIKLKNYFEDSSSGTTYDQGSLLNGLIPFEVGNQLKQTFAESLKNLKVQFNEIQADYEKMKIESNQYVKNIKTKSKRVMKQLKKFIKLEEQLKISDGKENVVKIEK